MVRKTKGVALSEIFMARRRRRRSVAVPILTIFTIMLVGIIGIMAFAMYKESRKVQHRTISLSEGVAARYYEFASEIDGNGLTYDDCLKVAGDINIELLITKADEKGKLKQEIVEESYNSARESAKNGLYAIYKKVIKNKISNEGYEGNITDEMVEKLMQENFNMSVEQYVSNQNIKLIDDYETMKQKYNVEVENE